MSRQLSDLGGHAYGVGFEPSGWDGVVAGAAGMDGLTILATLGAAFAVCGLVSFVFPQGMSVQKTAPQRRRWFW